MQVCTFPGARTIGKPRDWDDELDGGCGDIFVVDTVDVLSGLPIMYSFYKPTDADIEAFKNGGVLRLGIVGMKQHPVFNMTVFGPDITDQVQPRVVWDMGPVGS